MFEVQKKNLFRVIALLAIGITHSYYMYYESIYGLSNMQMFPPEITI